MATDKKSVILYCDVIYTFESLEDDEAGRLIKHLLRYVNDLNPVAPDKITLIAFEPIKQQLKRDLIKWEDKKEVKSISGHLGGIKSGEARRKQKEANEANASKLKQKEANEAVTVNVTVNDNVTVIKEYRRFAHLKISFDEFDKLISEGFSKQQIDETLDSIENYKKNKNYTSLLLTCRKWMKKNNLENGTSENDKFKLGRISGDKVAEFLQQ